MHLQTGVITQESYLKNVKSNTFLDLEKYNDDFLGRNKNDLSEYHSKWTNDSFHTWSRQFEYPYFFLSIEEYIKKNPDKKKIKILDAGSGLTFFPYLLSHAFPQVEVVCTDYDNILVNGYSRVNKNEKNLVKFVQSDLRDKKFPDKEFDIIYCVSVLEHTKDYGRIIENFNSYLVSGGQLILSFDISIDGSRDISVEGADNLLKALNQKFVPMSTDFLPTSKELKEDKFLTTEFVKTLDKKLLPWRSPYKNFLWCLKNLKMPKFYFNLALYCQTYLKK